ncbi:MAG: winged helix-turn-helix domain-containing protein [Bryobacteraceae bacterium]
MITLRVLRDPEQASILLQPIRLRILQALREPLSASALARAFAMPRQQVNYHLRELEKEGFVALIEERRKGNCMERVVQATAKSFVISPEALGEAEPMSADQFSAAYLVAAAARVIREVAQIASQARQVGKKLATFTLESEVRFRSPEERSAFAAEITHAFALICAKYDAKNTPEARTFRFVLGGYPAITKPLPVSDRTAALLD